MVWILLGLHSHLQKALGSSHWDCALLEMWPVVQAVFIRSLKVLPASKSNCGLERS